MKKMKKMESVQVDSLLENPNNRPGMEQLTEEKKIIPKKTLRIAPCGDVYITDFERKIIDTAEFQRLRGIKQLGPVLHVFPTALHTRFDHSLGTHSMADRMIKSIRNNAHNQRDEARIDYEQEVIARLYALLHDICHVPFGHTIEDELRLITRHDHNARRIMHFLGPDSNIGRLILKEFNPDFYDRFMSIFIWEEGKTWDKRMEEIAADGGNTRDWEPLKKWGELKEDDAFIYDLVSNTVCADLLDYIERDNYFCDLGCSLEYRFINFLYLKEIDNKRRVFVRLWKEKERIPRRDTLTDLTRLLEARYILAERVYFHHAKIISAAMIGRAVQELLVAGILNDERLCEFSDDQLLSFILSKESDTAKKLIGNWVARKLHKQLDHLNWDHFSALQAHDHSENIKEIVKGRYINAENRRKIENRIAEEIGVDPGDVLIYAPPRRMNMKAAQTKVIWNGAPSELQDIDDKIVGPRLAKIIEAHEALWRIYIIHSRQLNSNQLSLLRDAWELNFKCNEHDRKDHEQKYLKEIIIDKLQRTDGLPQMDPALLDSKLEGAVKDLQTAQTDKNYVFQDQLKRTIDRHFRS
jgi:hypothetical protein